GAVLAAVRDGSGVNGGPEQVLPVLQRGAPPPVAGLPDSTGGVPAQPGSGLRQARQKRSAARMNSSGVCQGMGPVSERGNGPQAGRWLAWGQRWPFGAPSAGLSLGGLLASRAHLRFTRRGACTATTIGEQGQAVQHARLRMCYGYDGRTGQSEGSHGFGLDNGVHLKVRVLPGELREGSRIRLAGPRWNRAPPQGDEGSNPSPSALNERPRRAPAGAFSFAGRPLPRRR